MNRITSDALLASSSPQELMTKKKHSRNGLILTHADAGTAGVFISATADGSVRNGRDLYEALYQTIGELLTEKHLVITHERVFASLSCQQYLLHQRQQVLRRYGIDPNTPLSLIHGCPPWGVGLAGALFHAVPRSIAKPAVLDIDGIPVGRTWSSGTADYAILQFEGNKGSSPQLDLEADEIFRAAASVLAANGFSFTDLSRTWFYIHDILDHYQVFNQVRDKHYVDFELTKKADALIRLPASTGIGGTPANRSALAADFLVVKPKCRGMVRQLSNPAQKEAFHYGASFSRAVLIREQSADIIQVSGTASIGEDGRTLHPTDGASQIACTLDKLEALLETASARLNQIATANIFLKNPALWHVFQWVAKERGLNEFPGVPVIADICRDDLLFEIDAEVVVPKVGL
jgi:enamine deaminase RidA (YjgF/YER057c/UK114 family)